jgi:methyl-accepting chemotaxis protein
LKEYRAGRLTNRSFLHEDRQPVFQRPDDPRSPVGSLFDAQPKTEYYKPMKIDTMSLKSVFPVLQIVTMLISGILAFFSFPSPVPLLLCALIFAGGAASFVLALSSLRREKSLENDFQNVLTFLAKQLGHGLSSFASGDLRFRLRKPAAGALDPSAASLAKRLLAGIDDFNSITNAPLKRVCFVGANSYQEGLVSGSHIDGILGGKGKIVYFIPAYSQVNHVLRMKGCHDYVSENCPNITSLPVVTTNGDPDTAASLALAQIAQNPDLSLIYVTDGHTPAIIAKALAASGNTHVKLFVYDATADNIALLKKGAFCALIEQNTFAQTYNALVHLYNACESSWVPISRKMYMDPIYIDGKNYTSYWDDNDNRRIMKERELAQLAVPVPSKTAKRYRFGVIMPQLAGFFAALVNGAEAAAKELKKYNVEVEIIDTYHTQQDFGSAALYAPVIESFVKKGYDGFITGIIDSDVMPAVNAAADKGLKIATFSTEPSSFREIILTVVENMEKLAENSQSLAAAAEQSSRVNSRIASSISGIKLDLGEQKKRIGANETELVSLNEMITNVEASITDYARLVKKMSEESVLGSASMDETFRETQGLKSAIDQIGGELETFNDKLGKVREFAGVIEELAESTNVLAINASIQAARAGVAGKAFAVVAGEVRSLAGNSRNTAESIRGLVGDITQNMARILEFSAQGTERVNRNIEQSTGARKSFESIASTLEESNGSVERIKGTVSGIAAFGSSVKTNMGVIEKMSDATGSRIEEISVSIGELGLQGAHLSSTANGLRLMAAEQGEVFSQLSVRDGENKK